MKLSVVRDSLAYRHGKAFYTFDTFLRFVNFLARDFEEVDLFLPVSDVERNSESLKEFNVDKPILFSPNINVIGTFPHRTVVDYYRNFPRAAMWNKPLFRDGLGGTDAVLLSLPSNNFFLVGSATTKSGTPLFTYVAGSQEDVVRSGYGYKGLIRPVAIAASKIHGYFFRRLVRSSAAVFYLGEELMKKYPPGSAEAHNIFTSLITDSDVRAKENVWEKGPLRILYIGRISHEKGLFDLLQAMKMLADEDLDIELTLCGTGPAMESLAARASGMGIRERVHFKGFVAHGPEMDSVLEDSHIFVLPSVSEGVPKVLIEAMAKGLPVIATRVGGIPSIIEDGSNGVLVPPSSPVSLADEVRDLVANKERMERISRQGLAFAREHTAEKQAGYISRVIKDRLL